MTEWKESKSRDKVDTGNDKMKVQKRRRLKLGESVIP